MATPKKPIKALTKADGDGVLSIKYVDIFTIDYLPDNIKAHDLEEIKASIRDHGFVEPIGINRNTGHDIFGNGRLEALREMHVARLEWKRSGEATNEVRVPKGIIEKVTDGSMQWFAPVVDGLTFDLNEEIALAMRMNKIAEKGGIDPKKAIAVLSRLRETAPERFLQTGYNQEDLDRIRQLARFNKQKDDYNTVQSERMAASEPAAGEDRETFAKKLNRKWKVKKGDVWQIGKHHLACVDSTATKTVTEMFFTAPKARLCFTSPPYDSQRTYELDPEFDWTKMMNGVSDTIFEILHSEKSDCLVNLGLAHQEARVKFYWNEWLAYVNDEHKMPLYGLYVWDRLVGYPGNHHGRLGRSFEFLFHFSRGHAQANKWIPTTGETIKRGPIGWTARKADGGLKPINSIDTFGQDYKIPDSVIRLNADMTRGVHTQGHPAVFPVHLAEFVMNTWSKPGDTVYEPFSGSGTTIIAAQNLDRICLASEISQNYCAVALERIQAEFPDLEIKKL